MAMIGSIDWRDSGTNQKRDDGLVTRQVNLSGLFSTIPLRLHIHF